MPFFKKLCQIILSPLLNSNPSSLDSTNNGESHNNSHESLIQSSSENKHKEKCHTTDVFEDKYYDDSYFDSSPTLKSFLKRTVSWKTINYPSLLKQANEGKIEFMSESEVDLAFDEIQKLFTEAADDNSEPMDVEQTPVEDFKRNGSVYVMEYIQKKAENIFEKFWEHRILSENNKEDLKSDLKDIYIQYEHSHHIRLELRYLEHLLIEFLVKKYKKDENKKHSILILKIMKVYCLKIKIPSRFTLFFDEIDLVEGENLSNPNNTCLEKYYENINNLAYVAKLTYINYSSIILDSIFFIYKNQEIRPRRFYMLDYNHSDLASLHFIFTTLCDIYKYVLNLQIVNYEFFTKNCFYIKFVMSLFISQIISIKQYVLDDLICILNKLEKKDFEVKKHDKSFFYEVNSINCHHRILSFSIMYNNLPVNLRSLCLHASINTIKKFNGVTSSFSYSEMSHYNNILGNLRDNLILKFYIIKLKHDNYFDQLLKLLQKNKGSKLLTSKIFFIFISVNHFRVGIQYILRQKFLSFKFKFSNCSELLKFKEGIIYPNPNKNEKEQEKKILDVVVTFYEKISDIEVKQLHIYSLLSLLMNALFKSKTEKITDINFYHSFYIFKEYFTDLEFKMLNYDFSDTENLYRYNILYSKIGKMLMNHGKKDSNLNIAVNEIKNFFQNKKSIYCTGKKGYTFSKAYKNHLVFEKHIIDEITFIKLTYKNIKMIFDKFVEENLSYQSFNYLDALRIFFDSNEKCTEKINFLSKKEMIFVTEVNFRKNGFIFCFVLITNKIHEIQAINQIEAFNDNPVVQNVISISHNKYNDTQKIINCLKCFISQYYDFNFENTHLSYLDGIFTQKYYIFEDKNISFFKSITELLSKIIKNLIIF